jgi:hypothetical protein
MENKLERLSKEEKAVFKKVLPITVSPHKFLGDTRLAT